MAVPKNSPYGMAMAEKCSFIPVLIFPSCMLNPFILLSPLFFSPISREIDPLHPPHLS